MSDCCLRRNISAVSRTGANVGELKVLDISVRGVDGLERWLAESMLVDDDPSDCAGAWCVAGRAVVLLEEADGGPPSQFAQK